MATPVQILAVICPAMLATDNYQAYIDMATSETALEFFGAQYEKAIALRAAHSWTLNTKRGSQSGVVTYRMEGRLAESYGGIGVVRHELELTNYGLQLRELMKSMKAIIGVTDSSVIGSL
jgi:hypothetical protein